MTEPVFAFRRWAQTIEPEILVPEGEDGPSLCGDCGPGRKDHGFCGFEAGRDFFATYCARTGTLRPWRRPEPVYVPPRTARAPRPKQNRQLTLDEQEGSPMNPH